MELFKRLTEIIPYLEPYPVWVKTLVCIWTIFTAVLALSFVFAPKQASSPSEIRGRIIDSISMAPVASASVELTAAGSTWSKVSDSAGEFSFHPEETTAGPGRLRIAAAKYITYERNLRLSRGENLLGDIQIILEKQNPVDDLTAELQRRLQRILSVPADIEQKYSSLSSTGTGGVIKLLSEATIQANRSVMMILNGEGRYYSFTRRAHEYGTGSDIKLEAGSLQTGFAGLDYGYFLSLPGVTFDEINASQKDGPDSLSEPKRVAWRYFWEYKPPSITKEVRKEQREARKKTVAGIPIPESATAIAGACFLLRSIQYNQSDILVALRVERVFDDGSLILAWKVVASFDTPVASGPEPEDY